MVSCPVGSRKQLQRYPMGGVKRAAVSTVLAAEAALSFDANERRGEWLETGSYMSKRLRNSCEAMVVMVLCAAGCTEQLQRICCTPTCDTNA